MENPKTIRAFAPATVSNVGCGYDIMGFPLMGYGDTITLEERTDEDLVIKEITGASGIPHEPEKNVASVAISAFMEKLGKRKGFDISIHKNIAPGSGLGSSASSSVAAVFAANAYFGKPFETIELVPFAMAGESVASAVAHADNVGPSLLGGFTVIRSYTPLDIFNIPFPQDLHVVVIYPQIEIKTADARKMLRPQVNLTDAVIQWGNVAGLVSGLITGDYKLIGRSLQDVIVEPVRSILIPYYPEIKEIAMGNGALGFNISGSGPCMFAMTTHVDISRKINQAVSKFLNSKELSFQVFESFINMEGAKLT